MALSDLISKPVVAPLEGFDKSVQTGFELAQNQERINIAQQNVALQQQQISDAYLDKAVRLLPTYLAADPRTKKLLGKTVSGLLQKGGVDANPEIFSAIDADKDFSSAFASRVQELSSQYGNRPELIRPMLQAEYGKSLADAYGDTAENIAKAKIAAAGDITKSLGIAERQRAGFSQQERALVSKGVETSIQSLDKSMDGMLPAMTRMEAMIGTASAPREFTMAELNNLLPTIAKTIGGETGVLTDNDVKRQLADTLEMDIKKLQAYLNMGTKAPKEFQNLLRNRYSAFKKGLIAAASSKMINRLEQGQYSTAPELFEINVKGKDGVSLGSAAIQLINRSNAVLKNTGAASGTFALNDYINSQSAPPTQAQILETIRRQIGMGNVVYFGKAPAQLDPNGYSFTFTFDKQELEEIRKRKEEALKRRQASKGEFVGPYSPQFYKKPENK